MLEKNPIRKVIKMRDHVNIEVYANFDYDDDDDDNNNFL